MASKDDLQVTLALAKINIEEFKADAKQARGNMGSMLDNLALGLKNLTDVVEGLVEKLQEFNEVSKDED